MQNVRFSELDILRQRESALEKQETILLQEMYRIRQTYGQVVMDLVTIRTSIEQKERHS